MSEATTMGGPRSPALAFPGRDIVEFALRAPSVHNTQPWRWRLGAPRLELHADRRRQLPLSDPDGRSLTVSCGAALEYAVVGAAAAGWGARVEPLPDPQAPDHLATVHLTQRPPTPRDAAHAELLRERSTDRRRLIPWPVPLGLLEELAERSSLGGARALVVTSLADRVRVALLTSRALAAEGDGSPLRAEQESWLAGRGADATPAAEEARLATTATDGLLIIVTDRDDPTGWLDAGRVLCRIWAEAMARGLAVVPARQVVQVAETRAALHAMVGETHPQLLLRLGWQELARPARPRSPRRPLDEVLLS